MNNDNIAEIRCLFGALIIDNVLFRVMINMKLDKIVHTIQNKFDVQKLPRELEAIMNCWIRTDSWYVEHGVSKFEACLEEVVADEMVRLMIDFLLGRKNALQGRESLNESDLCDALKHVSNVLTTMEWETETILTYYAMCWAQNFKDRILSCDYDHDFSWVNEKTRETHYNLPHVSKCVNNEDSEPLFENLQHETGL
jgi:hypothetical protein